MAATLRCEFFGRSFKMPTILKSILMPREIKVNTRPRAWSVPKRFFASDWVMTAVLRPVSVVPAASGKLTTFRKSSSVKK